MKGRMSSQAAARIQSGTAKSGGNVGKGSFPARALSAAAKTSASSAQGAIRHGQGQASSN